VPSKDAPEAHTKSYWCHHVATGVRPILLVSRPDGDWCVLCGKDDHSQSSDGFHVIGLGHASERDATIEQVLDLLPNEEAERDAPDQPWTRRVVGDA
jgi:hypothetical protein